MPESLLATLLLLLSMDNLTAITSVKIANKTAKLVLFINLEAKLEAKAG
jgi:hypothetical protein